MRADKEKIIRLLKTARGQIDGILRMIEEDRYCLDISNQLMATGSVLNRTNKEVLRAHMEGCVRSAFESGDVQTEKEKIDEIINLLDKLMK